MDTAKIQVILLFIRQPWISTARARTLYSIVVADISIHYFTSGLMHGGAGEAAHKAKKRKRMQLNIRHNTLRY